MATTSYTNPKGSGDRRSTIIVTTTASTAAGDISNIINGNTADDGYRWNASSNNEIRFDFNKPQFVDEAMWWQSDFASNGTWQWQGSSDGTAWTNIGGSLGLGGSSTFTFSSLRGNITAYRYYRLFQISGSTSSTTFIREIEFKIASLWLDFPTSPTDGQVFIPTHANGSGPIWIYNSAVGAWQQRFGTALPFNKVVNPSMQISQQNGSNTQSVNGAYVADQWIYSVVGTINNSGSARSPVTTGTVPPRGSGYYIYITADNGPN